VIKLFITAKKIVEKGQRRQDHNFYALISS
jgi:hypothetical protein